MRSYNRYSSREDEDFGVSALPPPSSRLNRYSSRDDDDLGGSGLPPPSSRLNRYSTSFDAGGDDFTSSYSTSAGQRRQGRYSYYSEEGSEGGATKSSYSRRFTTDLDSDLYRVGSMIDEESIEQRRYQGNTSKTLSRLDSKDAAVSEK